MPDNAYKALQDVLIPVLGGASEHALSQHAIYRVEVRRAAAVAKASKPVFGCQLTISDHLPINEVILLSPKDTLGWLDHNRLDHLRIKRCGADSIRTGDSIDQYFCAEEGLLCPLHSIYAVFIGDCGSKMKEQGVMLFTPAPFEGHQKTNLTH